jgi:hypothetical protein
MPIFLRGRTRGFPSLFIQRIVYCIPLHVYPRLGIKPGLLRDFIPRHTDIPSYEVCFQAFVVLMEALERGARA